MRFWAGMLVWLTAVASVQAATVHPAVKTGHNTVELVSETTAAAPGRVLYVALRQQIAPGWHTYWRNPGDAGQATTLSWTLPPGWKAGDIAWPAPERFKAGPIMNYVYTGEVYLPVAIQVPAAARPGSTVTLKADADWLVCKDICIPENAMVSLTLPVAAATPAPDPRDGPAIRAALAAVPKPAGLTAAYQFRGDTLKLAVVGPPLRGADAAHAYFFPYDGTVIDQAHPQLAERGPDGLTLSIAAGYAFTHHKPIKSLDGVLSLGARAYEIAAKAGPLPKGAAGLAPPIASTPAPPEEAGRTSGGSASGGLGLLPAIGLAFLGGLVLNLFPCVFPVLSMKAVALLRHAESTRRARIEGVAFLVGVVASFLVLAGVLIALRAGGQAVGWGFQMQSPGVVATLTLVMLAVGLNLSGVFEFGLSAQGAGASLAARAGLAGAFFTGVLAVVVAAPCTVAFMATAIGWALVQPPLAALTVFAVLGLGLAAPFTLASFTPGLFRWLPPAGGWMEGVKKAFAFPMYGAAAWLAWVFALETGVGGLPLLFAAAIAFAFAAWLFGAAQRGAAGPLRVAARGVALVGLAAAVTLGALGSQISPPAVAATADPDGPAAASGSLPTEPWSPARVAALQSEGKPVFVDFTAAWCVTCQVNERTTLATAKVADAFRKTGAIYLKADWTRRDPRIAQALAAEGRSGVPLYLVYGKDPQPRILPQLLTPGVVTNALEKAAGAPVI